jgi:hypothetical protein
VEQSDRTLSSIQPLLHVPPNRFLIDGQGMRHLRTIEARAIVLFAVETDQAAFCQLAKSV